MLAFPNWSMLSDYSFKSSTVSLYHLSGRWFTTRFPLFLSQRTTIPIRSHRTDPVSRSHDQYILCYIFVAGAWLRDWAIVENRALMEGNPWLITSIICLHIFLSIPFFLFSWLSDRVRSKKRKEEEFFMRPADPAKTAQIRSVPRDWDSLSTQRR